MSKPIFGLVPLLFLVAIAGISRMPVEAAEMTCTNSYGGTQTKTFTLPPGTQYAGDNQLKYIARGDDVAGAKADIGKTFYTPELTTFTDAQCARGPCNHSVPGTAHRSWPIGACVAICNLHNKECAIAVVMDRGPNTALGCRAIDGNVALKAKLKLSGMTQATYQLLSLTGPCDTGGPMSIPMPDPTGSVTTRGPGPDTSAAPVGTPTQVGSPAQAAYRQPADYSNYQSPSNTQPGQYFQPGTGLPGTSPLPIGQSPIYQSSSTADYLLNLITNTPGRVPTTTPFRLFIDRSIASTTTARSQDTVIVTPLMGTRPTQTFTPQTQLPSMTTNTMTQTLASIVAQLQSIFARIRALVGAN